MRALCRRHSTDGHGDSALGSWEAVAAAVVVGMRAMAAMVVVVVVEVEVEVEVEVGVIVVVVADAMVTVVLLMAVVSGGRPLNRWVGCGKWSERWTRQQRTRASGWTG